MARFITLRCYFDGRLSERTLVTLNTDQIAALESANGNGSLATVHLTSGTKYGLEAREFKQLAAVFAPGVTQLTPLDRAVCRPILGGGVMPGVAVATVQSAEG